MKRTLRLTGGLGALILVSGLVLILFYPFETKAVPIWRIQVVNPQGTPIARIGVREYWGDDSVDYHDSVEDLAADENGFVTFGARTVRANLFQRILYPIENLMGGFHSSWGPHASVIVLVDDASREIGTADWAPGKPLPEKIVVLPMKASDEPKK